MTGRGDVEAAVRKELNRSWDIAVAYCASNLVTPGVPLGYPEEESGTAAVMAAFDACAAELGPQDGVRFVTVKELAAAARVSVKTVYRVCASGDLGAVRIGRAYRIPEHRARQYLAGMPGAGGGS